MVAEKRRGVVVVLAALILAGGAFWAYERRLRALALAPAEDAVGRVAHAIAATHQRSGWCGDAEPVPKSIDDIRAGVYTPAAEDFASGDVSNGWRCLAFDQREAMNYRLEYEVLEPLQRSPAGCSGVVEVRASLFLDFDPELEVVSQRVTFGPDCQARVQPQAIDYGD